MKNKVPFLISSTMLVWLSSQGCMFAHDTDCQDNSDCSGGRTCQSGTCVGTRTGSDSSSGNGSPSPTASPSRPASCSAVGSTGYYCSNNTLYSCSTNAVARSCASCKWIGPGTGTSYDTTCKAQPSDCTVCGADDPWTGAGCYFGGGPAVCSAGGA